MAASEDESKQSRGGETDRQIVEQMPLARDRIAREVAKRIVGQERVVERLLISLFARGHCLFVGVPGLAKTLLINTLADSLGLRFNRIQFTPDLMPSDITGTDVLEEDPASGRRTFRFVPGPIFCNILLADEINRTPPKTQAALLQSMQEYQVTAGGRTYALTLPYLVFATQNPIEQEGTYPLPEAQLDRFMFQVDVEYPTAVEEEEIVRRTTAGEAPKIEQVLKPAQILTLQEMIPRTPVAPHVIAYAVQLARRSRPTDPSAPDFVREFVSWGAGPRASQYLVLGAKARAALDGRFVASVEDVRALARPVMRHRLVTNFHAEAEGVSAGAIVDRLLEQVPAAGE